MKTDHFGFGASKPIHNRYLSEMDVRYATKHIKFESAEGCYSQAVISKKDIKVKVGSFHEQAIETQLRFLTFGTRFEVGRQGVY